MLNTKSMLLTLAILLAAITSDKQIETVQPYVEEKDYIKVNDYICPLVTRLDSPSISVLHKDSEEIILKWQENPRWMSNPPTSFIDFSRKPYILKYISCELINESAHHRIARDLAYIKDIQSKSKLLTYLDLWQTAPCVALEIDNNTKEIKGYISVVSARMMLNDTRFKIEQWQFNDYSFTEKCQDRVVVAYMSAPNSCSLSLVAPGMNMQDYNYALIPAIISATEMKASADCELYFIVGLNAIEFNDK